MILPLVVSPPRTRIVTAPRRRMSVMNSREFEEAKPILELAVTMRTALASKTHDRRWRKVKVYKNCFLHSDSVEWMEQYLSKNKENEENAIDKLNELVEAGYVSHVKNEHRFEDDKKAVLFFRFHDKAIDSELKYARQRENGQVSRSNSPGALCSTEEREQIASLQLAVDRLGSSLNKYSAQLDDAHGRIVVLEEAVGSLGFACAVMVFTTILMIICRSLPTDWQGPFKLGLTTVLIPAILLWSPSGRGKPLLSIIPQHVSVLAKLMHPSAEMEDAFMQDIETEESILRKSGSTQVPPVAEPMTKRSSIYNNLTKAFSLKSLSSRGLEETSEDGLIKMREGWDLPDPQKWPHRPVMVCVNTPVSRPLTVPKYGTGPCPLGVPFEFSSELFEGKCLVRLRDVPSDDPVGDASYFLGRRRRFQSIVQGRFKVPLQVDEVLTGHEFVRPLQRLPPSWMVRAGTNLIKRLAPGADIVLNEPQPRALSILAATSQAVSADMPGNEPNICAPDILEDASLLGGYFCEQTVSAGSRKRHLADPKRASQYTFDTESVYTFDFYQQLLDVGTYSLDLGFTKIGLAKSLDGQPIQVLCKSTGGKYLWSFQIWHEDLLEAAKQ